MSNTKTVMSQAANTLTTPLNVEDVFSTYLYEGNGTSQTITNGIDLDGEGGLTWIKWRAGSGITSSSHLLFDTERGAQKALLSDQALAELTDSSWLTSFNSDGFVVGDSGSVNDVDNDYASWTFRKAPKFFDVVTYTGDGTSNRAISHNLGVAPAFITVKQTSGGGSDWTCYHRSLGESAIIYLNATNAAATSNSFWDNTAPTSSTFTVSSTSSANASGETYVAYLFAHNDGDGGFNGGDIIKCGSYTGDGSADGSNTVDLGFEPQWIMIKRAVSSYGDDWVIFDAMRGITTGGNEAILYANSSNAEFEQSRIRLTSTGFALDANESQTNFNGDGYIYIAIRRGTKVPESGTEVFAPTYPYSVNGNITAYLGSPTDAVFQGLTGGGNSAFPVARSRLTGGNRLTTSSTAAEVSDATSFWDNMFGFHPAGETGSTNTNTIYWNFKRAPKFFDAVAYTGDGVAGRTVSHNLGVAPEMIWVKRRDASGYDWNVYVNGQSNVGYLNSSNAFIYSQIVTATANSSFTLNNDIQGNASGGDYIAYLFASLDGVSKVGTFSHTFGTDTTVDCGFTSGARFVLIKNYDTAGDWYVFDSERGIVAGDDKMLELNSTNAENTGDFIDPHPTGFTLVGNSWGSRNCIFYAIA